MQEGKRPPGLTEPEANWMRSGRAGVIFRDNVQSAVNVASGVIVHHALTTEGGDNRQGLPMSKAVNTRLQRKPLTGVADAGDYNGEPLADDDRIGSAAAVPSNRATHHQGEGPFDPNSALADAADTDPFICPAGPTLTDTTKPTKNRRRLYRWEGGNQCALPLMCPRANRRWISRHFDEEAFERAEQRRKARPELMRVRMATVERPLAILKRPMGLKRMPCRGMCRAKSEISLG